MKITMLGTGNALVTECYNTCFVIEDNCPITPILEIRICKEDR